MKKKFLLSYFLFFTFNFSFSQGVWTWVNGSNTAGAPAVYGTQGIPATGNTPPGMYEACEWTDQQGNFWLFGGEDNGANLYGDLWKYNSSLNEWAWINGPGTVNGSGLYGTMGVTATANHPPAKGFGVCTWADLNGNLWMYGGSTGGGNALNDLWKYTIATNTWTWLQGDSTSGNAPVYGTSGIPSSTNTPGAIFECSASWVDSIGNLWFFGGLGGSNDLWRFDISLNQWAWMKGSGGGTQSGVYGTLGVPDTANVPPSRDAYCSWKDLKNKFWVFGGRQGLKTNLGDMWMYNPANNEWAWMSGSQAFNDSGSYGALCTSSVNYAPAARIENRARWVDDCGNLWMYGGWLIGGQGIFYNDLWSFNPTTLKWTLVNGGSLNKVTPVFGTVGVPAASNQPGGRMGGNAWKANDGSLYIFGGAVDAFPNDYNDIWKFQPDPNCPAGGASVFLGNDTTYCGPFSRVLVTNNPGTLWSTGDIAAQITVTAAGKYWATVNAGCGAVSDTIIISINSVVSAGIINAQNNTICPATSTGLTLTGSVGNIQWQSSADGISFSIIAAASSATYHTPNLTQPTYYRVKTSNSCGADSSAAIKINITPLPVAGTLTSSRDSICEGTGIVSDLSDTGSEGQIEWQSSTDGINFSEISADTSNTYTTPRALAQTTYYQVVTSNSCGSNTSNTVPVYILPAPSVNFTYTINGKQVSFQADSVTGGVVSYSWNFGDGETSNEINPVHTFDSVKTYYVCLTVYNGSNCSYTYCQYVSAPNGVQNISTPNSIRLYPNPVSEQLTVSSEQSPITELEIMDLLGQTLIQLNTYKTKIQIDVGALAAGIYFVKTQLGDGSVGVRKFVKE